MRQKDSYANRIGQAATKVFSRRRRIIAGLRSQLSVNGEIVYEHCIWERNDPPILSTLRRFWSNIGESDIVVLRLISREYITEYVLSPDTGSFTLKERRRTTYEQRKQYSTGYKPGLDGSGPYWTKKDHDPSGVQKHPVRACILFDH